MGNRNLQILLAVAFITVLSLWVVWPQVPTNYLPDVLPWPKSEGVHVQVGGWKFDRQGMRLGLDLQGGTQLVLEADLSKVETQDKETAMSGVRSIVDRRINAFGVSEPSIQQQGDNRIAVQLPGIKNIDEAVSLIGQTAQLEFKERTLGPDGQYIEKSTGLTGADLKKAYADKNPTTGEPIVQFEFNERGAKIFGDLTQRLAGSSGQIAVYLDKELVTSPTVRSPILEGKGYIEGSFTTASAKNLAIQLSSGALPVPVSIIKQQDVDATLGADSIKKSIIAGEIGMLIVIVFMLSYYRLPGLLASGALIVYTLINLAIFKLIPVTLTLAGIAAFILSIGMAVDANILIFERMREEIRAGRTLGAAIEAGFARAWTSIRDSNMATIITCLILYWFGSNFGASMVMGFALTLFIGVVVSMFTAVVVTRTFLRVAQRVWFSDPRAVVSPRIRWLLGFDQVVEEEKLEIAKAST